MPRATSEPPSPTIAIDDDGDRLALTGALDIRTMGEAEKALTPWPKKQRSRALDLSKPGAPRFEAFVAIRELFHIPQIGENAAALQADPVIQSSFERRQLRRRELAALGQRFQRAVAEARGNERHNPPSAIEGKINRALRPVQRLGFVEERRLDENENAESDVIVAQKFGSAAELVERHPFVQFLQDLRMRCLQAHRHFQLLPGAGTVSSAIQRGTRDPEPTPNPSNGGERGNMRRGGVPLPGGVRGGLGVRRAGLPDMSHS